MTDSKETVGQKLDLSKFKLNIEAAAFRPGAIHPIQSYIHFLLSALLNASVCYTFSERKSAKQSNDSIPFGLCCLQCI